MKLPQAEHAVIEREKIEQYCLNDLHPTGKHKARVFHSTLGLTIEDTDELIQAIKHAIRQHEADVRNKDKYGQRFTVDFMFSHKGKEASIRTNWIIRSTENNPRLTSCYVK